MRFLILLIVGLGPWFSVWGGVPEQWGNSQTEVTGQSKNSSLFDKTYDTSVNDTPEPQGPEVEDDIETSEGYAAEPNATESEEGDDGTSDIAMEEDDLVQANPGLNLDQKKAAGKEQSATAPDVEADDEEESDDSASDTQEESLDAPDDTEDTDSEEA